MSEPLFTDFEQACIDLGECRDRITAATARADALRAANAQLVAVVQAWIAPIPAHADHAERDIARAALTADGAQLTSAIEAVLDWPPQGIVPAHLIEALRRAWRPGAAP